MLPPKKRGGQGISRINGTEIEPSTHAVPFGPNSPVLQRLVEIEADLVDEDGYVTIPENDRNNSLAVADSIKENQGPVRFDFAPPKQPIQFDKYRQKKAVTENQPAQEKRNREYFSDYTPDHPGFNNIGGPQDIITKLAAVRYHCLHYLAVQVALLMNTPTDSRIRALLLEGPSGCGKSFLAKSLSSIAGAELMCLSCYRGIPTQNLVESPSTLAMANAMTGKSSGNTEELMNLGILSRAFLKSHERPVILLIDELDKPDSAIDTFFLGPIQDARIWLESRPPIDANPDNLLIIFTKNYNRTLDEALLRRVHPIKMTYLDSTLERKILSEYCHPQLVSNLVSVADRMRNSGGSYAFERPPAPEELLTAGQYVTHLLEWGLSDFAFVGKNIWAIIAKSDHDRAVLEHMMRYHPDFLDPLVPDSKNAPIEEIYARLGRIILDRIVEDPDAARRERAWKEQQ